MKGRAMTLRQVKQLGHGDEVYWNDPDGGKCSRVITIRFITIVSRSIVRITGMDGCYLECFAGELS